MTETTAQAIGRRIREVRQIRGWTQGELARRVGTHRPIVCRTEGGGYTTTIGTLVTYARALRVSPLLLVDDADPVYRELVDAACRGYVRPMPWAYPSARAGRAPKGRKGPTSRRNETHRARRAAGLCARCRNPNDTDGATCTECLEHLRLRRKTRHAEAV